MLLATTTELFDGTCLVGRAMVHEGLRSQHSIYEEAFPPDAPEGSTNPHRRLQRVPEQRDLDVDQMSVELADAYNTDLQAFLEHGNEGHGKESEATSLEGSLSRSEESLSGNGTGSHNAKSATGF